MPVVRRLLLLYLQCPMTSDSLLGWIDAQAPGERRQSALLDTPSVNRFAEIEDSAQLVPGPRKSQVEDR